MALVNNNFIHEVKSFANNHKVLCILTLGIALALYSLGNLVGRSVSWIIECFGTTQKTDIVARKTLLRHSEKKTDSISILEKVPETDSSTTETDSSTTETDSSTTEADSSMTVCSQKLDATQNSFAAFILELETEIFPFYEKHETGFDQYRIHGRLHVARAVIFGELMIRYYQKQGHTIDYDYVRRTIGLHDAGRKENGPDLWEKESSELLCNHLILKNTPKEEAVQKSSIIIKKNSDNNSIAFTIFQSADCLDIMRPCTGNGGIAGFKPEYLTFLKGSTKPEDIKFRENLIEEAWYFIEITEKQKKTEFNESSGFMDKLFQIIGKNQAKLPILSSILLK